MPRTKKVTAEDKSKKTSKSSVAKVTVAKVTVSKEDKVESKSPVSRIRRLKFGRRAIVAVVIVILLFLAYSNKGFFVAAMVNNQPITGLELNQRINSLYKDKVLSQMINEKILEQEARKNGIVITPQDIDAKVAQVENQYGGKDAFNSLLAQQELSRDEFTRSTRLQLIVEKMYSKDASPSSAEIDKYMEDNKTSPEATEPAKFRQSVIEGLSQQKLSDLVSQKFPQLKQNSKIQIF